MKLLRMLLRNIFVSAVFVLAVAAGLSLCTVISVSLATLLFGKTFAGFAAALVLLAILSMALATTAVEWDAKHKGFFW
jgi:hypothetical protein